MDFNNLIQTFIFMNIQNIREMTFFQMLPLLLFYFFQRYKEKIDLYLNVETMFYKKYKSEIMAQIITNEYGGIKSFSKIAVVLLWCYKTTPNVLQHIKKIKVYNFPTIHVERDKNGHYIYNHYLPSDNCSIVIDNDIELEFNYTEETTNEKDDVDEKRITVKEKIIQFKCKSNKKNNEELVTWLKKKQEEYYEWYNLDTFKYIYTSNMNNKSNMLSFCKYKFESTKTFDNLFFEGKELILDRLETYKDIKRYKTLGIPHSLGFLFYGEPGCGKTSCIKAIANYLDRYIVTINLNHINSINDLRNIFMGEYLGEEEWNVPLKKRIYVFEEIDCFQEEDNPFLNRNNVEKMNTKPKIDDKFEKLSQALLKDETPIKNKTKITTGEVLEILDGITEAEDRIIIFTTNFPDKIDKAFMRPGRIDVSINFKKLRREDINNLYKLWFNKSINVKAFQKIKDYSITQADFGKLCFENNEDVLLQKCMNEN
jgi:hypothetical protein